MSYRFSFNTRDTKFIMKEWLPVEEILAYPKYSDYYSLDDFDTIIDQVRKISEDIIAPTAEDADAIGAQWRDGQVYIPESFHKAIRFMHDNGWATSNYDEEGEGVLPMVLFHGLAEIMAAANPALFAYTATGSGVVAVMNHYASDEIKAKFLPKLLDGTWGGTMCLTEPTAGSDVGDMLSKAFPTDTPGLYKIKGQKIFITCGDRDDMENIIHLYLARVEGAKAGTKGLSLFAVPKYWINEDGSLTSNDFQCIGIEHKMGMKGSATCALVAGENNNCYGYIIGNPPNEEGVGEGMAQMFHMMNEARLDTGRLSLAVAANAYWAAKDYGKERIQGRLMTDPKAGRTTINKHEDVKRMYMLNKATTEACRALLSKCYFYDDMRENDPDPEKRKWAQGKMDMLTPLCKAYPSDEVWGLTAESLQSYGGYGYCEDYPAANSARDCKIWSIWEGTNFIQSMDLIGRKWMQGKGKVFASILGEIDDFIAKYDGNFPGMEKEMENLKKALAAYREIQMTIGGFVGAGKIGLMPIYARRILTATAQLYCGYLLMDQAVLCKKRMEELGPDHYDYNFYYGKVLSTRYYLNNTVPNVWHILEIIKMADTSILEAPVEIFDF